MSEQSAVEKLANEWARTDMPTWMDGPRAAESIRAAIEVDRAAGWLGPVSFHKTVLRDRARQAEAEVERLRRAYVCAPLGGCVADANRRNIARLRAELEDR